ncbi:2-oxo acid dehydrogenase subunit E2 [Hellea balneolensis]|uniref:2-oxo acid dehydrogenase subunit E2 n=1 Tax=Hellea balneolensis TaxID=287478 RepID=UPI0003F7CACD|nr:2-oxo acid dehydrogenase subunit E2 [Hellea balneolensis]
MGDYRFKLPDIGEGVVEAEITAWHVAVGDTVEEDAPIADAMTDKATIELTAPVSGVIKMVACEEGDMLAVGADLVVFETDGGEDDDKGDKTEAPNTVEASSNGSSTYAFKLPDIGEGVVEAEITAWHVAVGDDVEEDDPIADAMTDKATIELTSPVSGTVRTVACEEGEILAVGADLVVFDVEGGGNVDAETGSDSSDITPLATAIIPAKPQNTSTPPASFKKAAAPKSNGGKVLAAPAVRKAAQEKGLDLALAKASGKDGEVTHADLALLEKSFAQEEGETRIKVIGLRRVIAQRMQEAKRHIPHFTYVEEIDVTELEALRKRANEKKSEEKPKLTVLPFIIRALAKTLEDWPQFNARYMDEQGYVSQFSDLNLGIAAQTEAGLIVPVLKKAQTLSIWQMAEEIARLAEGARMNKLTTDDLTGATTTLTSLGPLGGIVTTPVINRPEVAIFGPNKIRKKLVLEGGEVRQRLVMNFSVSCDHRVIDGYDAAKMMQDMKQTLEDPLFMFLS